MKNELDKMLEIKNVSPTSADLYFYGSIVSSWLGAWDNADQYPENIKNFLNGATGKTLNIYINSPGGAVFAAMAIVNMLRRHVGRKICHVDGVAASSASVIALCGDELIMPRNTFLMIHPASAYAGGNSGELRKYAEILESCDNAILSVYEQALKQEVSIDAVKELYSAETWLSAEEAAKYFNITVAEAIAEPAAVYQGPYLDHAPQSLRNAVGLALERERIRMLDLKKI